MLRKACKIIPRPNGVIRVYGNGHWIPLDHEKPEWSEDYEPCFSYKGHLYFLSEFWNIHNSVHQPNPSDWMKEFDGYMNDSAWTGVLVKLGEEENSDAVKAYTFIASGA